MIHRYIPKAKRKTVSARMLAAKKAKRLRLGVDAETLRYRALHPLPITAHNSLLRNAQVRA